jgi:predicted phage terminase large subunit-like protein
MLVVGHRVAEDDVSAHILERGDFQHVAMPLFASKKLDFKVGRETLYLAKGEALRPDAYPPDEIESIRKHHQGPPFWLYYQQGVGPRQDDFQIDVSHFPFLPSGPAGRVPSGVPVVLSVDPAQKTNSTSRNVIHVYAIRGDRYEFLQAFAEKCSFRKLVLKVERCAKRYRAWFVLVENTARGPDLIEELQTRLRSVMIIPVNPRGTKAARLRQFASVIQAKRISIRQEPGVEAAIDEIVAFPHSPYDDHVDTMTNFLSIAPKLKPMDLTRFLDRGPVGGTALASRPAGRRPQVDGIASVRARSIIDRPSPLPDFSNERVERQPKKGGRSPYAANSEAIYAVVNGKRVLIT